MFVSDSQICISRLAYFSFLQLPTGHLSMFEYLTSNPSPGQGLIHYLCFPDFSLFCDFFFYSLVSVSSREEFQILTFFFFLCKTNLLHCSTNFPSMTYLKCFPFNLFCYCSLSGLHFQPGLLPQSTAGLPSPCSSFPSTHYHQNSLPETSLRCHGCSLLTIEIRL